LCFRHRGGARGETEVTGSSRILNRELDDRTRG
jgi:hypothetical protein